jgi:hypothetical protein
MSALQIHLFMQNKAKFKKVKSNLNKEITREYEQMDTWSIRKNEPKTNPNEPKTNPILANKTPEQTQFEAKTNPIQSRFKPKQTQFVVRLPALPALSVVEGCEAEGSNLSQPSTMLNCAICTANTSTRKYSQQPFYKFHWLPSLFFAEFSVLLLTGRPKSRKVPALYFPVVLYMLFEGIDKCRNRKPIRV